MRPLLPLLPRPYHPWTVRYRRNERGFGGIAPWICDTCGPVWRRGGVDPEFCPRCEGQLRDNDNDHSFHAVRRYVIRRLAIAA